MSIFIEIWVDYVKHCKICKKVERDTKCLKGIKIDCKDADYKPCDKPCEKPCDKSCDKDDKPERPCMKPCGRPC